MERGEVKKVYTLNGGDKLLRILWLGEDPREHLYVVSSPRGHFIVEGDLDKRLKNLAFNETYEEWYKWYGKREDQAILDVIEFIVSEIKRNAEILIQKALKEIDEHPKNRYSEEDCPYCLKGREKEEYHSCLKHSLLTSYMTSSRNQFRYFSCIWSFKVADTEDVEVWYKPTRRILYEIRLKKERKLILSPDGITLFTYLFEDLRD